MKNLRSFVCSLKKGELHIHLNGIVSSDTVKRILKDEQVDIPKGFDIDRDLSRNVPSSSLQAYLKPWEVLRLIPNKRKNLSVIVEDVFLTLKEQNVRFAEIRNSVLYLAMLNGISFEEAMTWLIEDIDHFADKYNIRAGLILTVTRGDYSAEHLRTLIRTYLNLGRPSSIIGLDLAGNEDSHVPDDLCYEFKNAKDKYGFNITIHAGETGNYQNVKDAIYNFSADRIGHGTIAGRHVGIMDLLREKKICLEICPISNRLTGAVNNEDNHPVLNFIKHEVPFVICSDNPSIHQSSISDDYISFFEETKNKELLEQMYSFQKKHSFLGDLL